MALDMVLDMALDMVLDMVLDMALDTVQAMGRGRYVWHYTGHWVRDEPMYAHDIWKLSNQHGSAYGTFDSRIIPRITSVHTYITTDCNS